MYLVRTIFNPSLLGGIIFVGYIFIWYRMEFLAKRRRRLANKQLAEDETTDGRTLENYTESTGGDPLFSHTSFRDAVNHMRSKGVVPLKISGRCQPYAVAPTPDIFWESKCVALRENPRDDTDKVYSELSSRAHISLEDVLERITLGGECIWKDSKSYRIFYKETAAWVKLDFHDAKNFIGLYEDRDCWKRSISLSAAQFLDQSTSFDFENGKIVFGTKTAKIVGFVKIHDNSLFLALVTLFCHTIVREETE